MPQAGAACAEGAPSTHSRQETAKTAPRRARLRKITLHSRWLLLTARFAWCSRERFGRRLVMLVVSVVLVLLLVVGKTFNPCLLDGASWLMVLHGSAQLALELDRAVEPARAGERRVEGLELLQELDGYPGELD